MSVSCIQMVFVEVLTEVDNGVLELASASSIITLSSSLVFLASTSNSNCIISKVVATALHALLFISVAVYLSDFVSWDSTLSMEAVGVLRDDVLEEAFVHQLDHGHVSLGWVSLSHVSLNCSHVFWRGFTSLLSLVVLCFNFPLARADWVHSIVRRSEISNSSSGRKTCSSEGDKVLGGENHLSQVLDLFVENFRRVEVLSLVIGVLYCSVHFVFD